jgi:hypothetical protein
MPVEHVPWKVIDVVLAGHNPAVGTIFPHGISPEGSWTGWEITEVILAYSSLLAEKSQEGSRLFTTFYTAWPPGCAVLAMRQKPEELKTQTALAGEPAPQVSRNKLTII